MNAVKNRLFYFLLLSSALHANLAYGPDFSMPVPLDAVAPGSFILMIQDLRDGSIYALPGNNAKDINGNFFDLADSRAGGHLDVIEKHGLGGVTRESMPCGGTRSTLDPSVNRHLRGFGATVDMDGSLVLNYKSGQVNNMLGMRRENMDAATLKGPPLQAYPSAKIRKQMAQTLANLTGRKVFVPQNYQDSTKAYAKPELRNPVPIEPSSNATIVCEQGNCGTVQNIRSAQNLEMIRPGVSLLASVGATVTGNQLASSTGMNGQQSNMAGSIAGEAAGLLIGGVSALSIPLAGASVALSDAAYNNSPDRQKEFNRNYDGTVECLGNVTGIGPARKKYEDLGFDPTK